MKLFDNRGVNLSGFFMYVDTLNRLLVYLGILVLSINLSFAQQVVQLKVFSEDLQPFGNIELSINQSDFVAVPPSGVTYVNLTKNQFPVKTITTSNKSLEAASWNFSKGVLEVTIRNKSYIDVQIQIVDLSGDPIKKAAVQFRGNKDVKAVSNLEGNVSLPLAIGEKIVDKNQFEVDGFNIASFNESTNTLKLIKLVEEKHKVGSKNISKVNEDTNWNLYVSEKLPFIDDIQSFYTFLTIIPSDKISQGSQMLIDQKFENILEAIKQDANTDSSSYIQDISDTTILKVDIDNLIRQMRKDGESISKQKIEFEEKISLVSDKLKSGFENLSEDEKDDLLANINLLETILSSNRKEFVDNQNSYKMIINELKRRFFDLQALENKLSESELERKREKKIYQSRMLAILAVVLVFALLIILLFYLRNRVKKQHNELFKANKIIKSTNENLETLVSERTHLLEKTFKELDLVLYRASHDLRAPICSIAGLSDLIARDTGNNELTNMVLKTNSRMDKLLKKLSTISEIHQAGDFKSIKVKPYVNQLIPRFSKQLDNYSVKLKLEIPDDLSFKTIPTLFEAIIVHLLENAIYFSQFTQAGQAMVSLGIAQIDDSIQITISDNGIGVDKSLQDKLFDMFYVGSEYSKGNGLGLYIVKKSVDILSGEIALKAKEQEFTSFIVAIPLEVNSAHILNFIGAEPNLQV